MFPVRCYTCNAVLAHEWPRYQQELRDGTPAVQILRDRGIDRMCCRRMFLSHVDLTDDQLAYPNRDIRLDAAGTILRRHTRHERVVSCD